MNNDDVMTIAEKLASAGNTSDLTVEPDRRRPVDVLIAAGLSPSTVGRYLDQLVSEWDGAVRPRRLRDDEIRRLAADLPRVTLGSKKGKPEVLLDFAGAERKAAAWYVQERRQAVARLKTVAKLVNPERGLIAWLAAKGVIAPEAVLIDVLCWYVERRCQPCGGTKWATAPGTGRHTGKACTGCAGTGETPKPHGQLGRDIAWFLDDCVGRARAGQTAALRNIRNVKTWAAGR